MRALSLKMNDCLYHSQNENTMNEKLQGPKKNSNRKLGFRLPHPKLNRLDEMTIFNDFAEVEEIWFETKRQLPSSCVAELSPFPL